MRIFITGGTGFIGRLAVKELQSHGHKLLLLVRHGEDLAFFPKRNLMYVYGDLGGASRIQNALKRFKPEAALHLAWEGIPDYSPELSVKNLTRSLALFEALARAGCKRIVGAGTCWEYGAASGKLDERMALKPFNAISAAKTTLHWLGIELAKKYGIDFAWGRIFFVYGPGQRPGALIPSLLRARALGLEPELKNPNGANDFVYVGDVARAFRMILERHKPGRSHVYNIGSGKLTTVREVVARIYGGTKHFAPKRNSGFYADITLIRKEIGWKPLVDIKRGIAKTLAYSREPSRMAKY